MTYQWKWKGKYHAGIDVIGGAIDGTAIRSVDSGTVAQTYLNVSGSTWGDFGYAVSIRLDGRVPYTTNTLHALYMHMKYVPEVTTGSRVAEGALIGYVGNTGESYGSHLHLQVSTNGQPYATYADCINPALFFPGILPQSRSADVLPDDPAMYEYTDDNILIPLEVVNYIGLDNVKQWVKSGGLINDNSSTATRKIISKFSVPNSITRGIII